MMKKRKIPMRKCIVSNEMFPKKELVRIVKNQEGVIQIDPTGKVNGRGAYVAMEPDLVAAAKEKRLFDRTFEMQVADEFYDELYKYVAHQKARKSL